jgi:hypothetical protein
MKWADRIEVGFQVFTRDGGEEFGAVREVHPDGGEMIVHIENAGDHPIPLEAVHDVHYEKVIVDLGRVPRAVRAAVRHAHDAERQGL